MKTTISKLDVLKIARQIIEDDKAKIPENIVQSIQTTLYIVPVIHSAIIAVQLNTAYQKIGEDLWATTLFAKKKEERNIAKAIVAKASAQAGMLKNLKEQLVKLLEEYKGIRIEDLHAKIAFQYLIFYFLNPAIILDAGFPTFLWPSEIPIDHLHAMFGLLRVQIDLFAAARDTLTAKAEFDKLFAVTADINNYPEDGKSCTIETFALSIWGSSFLGKWKSETPNEIITYVTTPANGIQFSRQTASLALSVDSKSTTAKIKRAHAALQEANARLADALKSLSEDLGVTSIQSTRTAAAVADPKSVTGTTSEETTKWLTQYLRISCNNSMLIGLSILNIESCVPSSSPQAQYFIKQFKALHPKIVSWDNFDKELGKAKTILQAQIPTVTTPSQSISSDSTATSTSTTTSTSQPPSLPETITTPSRTATPTHSAQETTQPIQSDSSATSTSTSASTPPSQDSLQVSTPISSTVITTTSISPPLIAESASNLSSTALTSSIASQGLTGGSTSTSGSVTSLPQAGSTPPNSTSIATQSVSVQPFTPVAPITAASPTTNTSSTSTSNNSASISALTNKSSSSFLGGTSAKTSSTASDNNTRVKRLSVSITQSPKLSKLAEAFTKQGTGQEDKTGSTNIPPSSVSKSKVADLREKVGIGLSGGSRDRASSQAMRQKAEAAAAATLAALENSTSSATTPGITPTKTATPGGK